METEDAVDEKQKSQEIILPSQEDIIEDISPIHKKARNENYSSDEVTWVPELDKIFLILQIGMSFIKDYDFVENESTPLDRARTVLQCAYQYREYRDNIQKTINSLESSKILMQHRHYRRAIRRVIDIWNTESDTLSTTYMNLKNKIPDMLKREIGIFDVESIAGDIEERTQLIYAYLTRDEDVPIHQLVDVFKKYNYEKPQDLSITSIDSNQNISNDLRPNMELETVENVDTSDVLEIVALERKFSIQWSLYNGQISEVEYDYPRSSPTEIANTGNSCYMNVILQMLWRIKVSCFSFPNR